MGPPRGRGAKAPGLGSRPDQGPRAPLQRAPWQGKFLPRAATSLGRFHSQPVLKNNYRSRSHHGENRHEKKATHLRVAKVQSLGGILLRSINKCFYEWCGLQILAGVVRQIATAFARLSRPGSWRGRRGEGEKPLIWDLKTRPGARGRHVSATTTR